ncbi:hypothetical protein EB74_03245 [Mycobacterium sp. SWH-M5]|uniref:hypothetical protein n=1 Tax=Mycolicibacterium goodii TaxID=134601 RepID=UPI00093906F7|nr:hypothetical protein [Mycolicibacterium goodii]MBU8817546.1 hypothetical protein [Mycolicibacterium goodii]OKH66795.1 hypothetical protein EB74_03245 [Mycobacterium sp. SWH-M5]
MSAGLELEVAGASQGFAAVARVLGVAPRSVAGGRDPLSLLALAGLNKFTAKATANAAAAVSNQAAAGATGTTNVENYVTADHVNADELGDTGLGGAGTVEV